MDKAHLRIVFMGTPTFAVGTLGKLVEGGYQVVAVVTTPDKPVGRHQNRLQPSPVKQYAVAHNIPVLQPVKLKDPAFLEQLASCQADLQVIVAFRMLPEIVWDMPLFGSINVHAALLPQYRGAAPINWAVINGETVTGVTTFFLDKNIDTGRIIMQKKMPIPDDADAEFVYDNLMNLGADTCIETIDELIKGNGRLETIDQNELPEAAKELKQAPKIFKETCQIDWHQPAKRIYDFIRGLSPVPAAWTNLRPIADKENANPQMLKIYKSAKTGMKTSERPGSIRTEKSKLFVAASDEWIEIMELQLSGKKRMPTKDFLNGMHDIDICQMTRIDEHTNGI